MKNALAMSLSDLLLSDYWWLVFVVPTVVIAVSYALWLVAERRGWLPAFYYIEPNRYGTVYQKFLFVGSLFLIGIGYVMSGGRVEDATEGRYRRDLRRRFNRLIKGEKMHGSRREHQSPSESSEE